MASRFVQGVLALAAGFPQLSLAQAPGAATLPVDSGRIAVPGSSLYYEAAGQGPPLILLHAGSLDRRMWDDQFHVLAQSHRVIRFDARGYGRSGPVSSRFDRSEDLHSLMKALRLVRATLVGSSLGGATAIDFALAHPERVDRLVLVGSGVSGYLWPPESRDVPWRVAARAAAARGDTAGIARSWLHSEYFAATREVPALAARLETLLVENVESWKTALRIGNQDTVFSGPALGRLHRITAPTIIVVGSRDVADIHRIADTLQAYLPRAQTVVLNGAGHVPNMELPSLFLEVVRKFLGTGR
jgi:3-oxoadipate enol-lactonase